MITVRKSEERGHANHGWLDSRFTFSFAEYYDERFMGFRALRVINEDHIQPGRGFGTHSHRDMEIITYVLAGALEHKDSMGTSSVIRPGEVQRMSAGTGVSHSEYNQSAAEVVHLLQIWIVPERRGVVPSYEQRDFPAAERRDRLRLVASRDGRDGSVAVQQDVALYAALLARGAEVRHELAAGRHAWLQVASGGIEVNGHALSAGDGAAISGESALRIAAADVSEVLLFDLA